MSEVSNSSIKKNVVARKNSNGCRKKRIPIKTLHYTVKTQDENLIEKLFGYGNYINQKSYTKSSPSSSTSQEHMDSIANFLRKNGADIICIKNDGTTKTSAKSRCQLIFSILAKYRVEDNSKASEDILFVFHAIEEEDKQVVFHKFDYSNVSFCEPIRNTDCKSSGSDQDRVRPEHNKMSQNKKTNSDEQVSKPRSKIDIDANFHQILKSSTFDGKKLVSFLYQLAGDFEKNAGQSPLHVAVLCEMEEAVDFLVQYDNNVNPIDEYGYAPLHYAIELQNPRIVMLLLDNGADINCLTNKHKSAVDLNELIMSSSEKTFQTEQIQLILLSHMIRLRSINLEICKRNLKYLNAQMSSKALKKTLTDIQSEYESEVVRLKEMKLCNGCDLTFYGILTNDLNLEFSLYLEKEETMKKLQRCDQDFPLYFNMIERRIRFYIDNADRY